MSQQVSDRPPARPPRISAGQPVQRGAQLRLDFEGTTAFIDGERCHWFAGDTETAEFWELIDGRKTADDLAASLARDGHMPMERARWWVGRALDELGEKGLVW